MRRIRQITAAIVERTNARRTEARRIASWQTRSLAMLIACTVPIREGDGNPLLDFARTLTIDPEELQMLEQQMEDGEEESTYSRPSYDSVKSEGPAKLTDSGLIKYPREQEVCKAGHLDEWVQWGDQDYKTCRKCDLARNDAAKTTKASSFNVMKFGQAFHGKPMPG